MPVYGASTDPSAATRARSCSSCSCFLKQLLPGWCELHFPGICRGAAGFQKDSCPEGKLLHLSKCSV